MTTARALLLSLALAAGTAVAADPAATAQPVTVQPATTQPVAVQPAPAQADTAQPVTAQPVPTPAAPAQRPALGSAAPAAAPAPVTSAPGSAGSLLQVVFGLLVVLGLLAGALWFLKRLGGGRFAPGSVVKIVGGVSVGNRERVMVVEVADQWIVIGVAPGQVNTLASMPRQEQPAAQAAAGAPNFSAWLKQTIEKRNAN
ncbi:flagellar biosynthetic protein FliO [Noviherbaspirillum suwonense]|jgi:flagellar protein FliO/FliZ|uniref:Flagellar protein n=1 Tax=Noviherbaspirillum suwonense TaxID=1224511 RepID=A0ABY1Q317_9BURK|nr:flagellar biosynthetic protein FliO [Noviherbaspirillum suwonense]SMP55610.1 flagellar protein FliO/FliZ [Noviherbaspirillum suwonense]